MIKIIACVGKNLELGKDNQLLFHFKKDMQFFRKMTLNSIVVMGRKTYESIGHFLPERRNIVLSRESNMTIEKIVELSKLEDVWVIGGASIYSQLLPFAQELCLTEVEESKEADVFFPNFDKSKYKEETLEKCEEDGIKFTFKRYLLLDSDSL